MFRIPIGLISVICLGLGLTMYFGGVKVSPVVPGILVRIGALMMVIWLAYPQLEQMRERIPAIVLGIAFLCLFLIAVRPKISHIIILVGGVAITVSSALKFLGSMSEDPRRRKK